MHIFIWVAMYSNCNFLQLRIFRGKKPDGWLQERKKKRNDEDCPGRKHEVLRTALPCLLEGVLAWRKWSTEGWTTLGVRGVDLGNTNSIVQHTSCQRFFTSKNQVISYLWLYLGTMSVERLVREPGTGKQMCLLTHTIYNLIQNHSLTGSTGEESLKPQKILV